MAKDRPVYLVIPTPFPGLPTLTLFVDTFTQHMSKHAETIGAEALIQATVSAPSVIVSGTTNPSYLVFVNNVVVSPGGGSPFVVIADPADQTICTALFNRTFKVITPGQVLWPR